MADLSCRGAIKIAPRFFYKIKNYLPAQSSYTESAANWLNFWRHKISNKVRRNTEDICVVLIWVF